MSAVRFSPGSGVAAVRPGRVVLSAAPITAARLAELAEGSERLRELVASSESAVAVAVVDDTAVTVLLRGAVGLEVDGVRLGAPAPTPVEHRVERGHTLELVLDDVVVDRSGTFEVVEGTVPAGAVGVECRGDGSGGRPRGRPGDGAPGRAATGMEPPDSFDSMFGDTVPRCVEDAAVRTDGDGRREPEPLGVLLFSTGDRVVVDRPLVLGRNPGSNHGPTDPGVRLVKVPGGAVSRRHAAVRLDHWQAFIDDLGSVNGTQVTLPGCGPRRLSPGEPIALAPGALVELGGDVSFVVEEVA